MISLSFIKALDKIEGRGSNTAAIPTETTPRKLSKLWGGGRDRKAPKLLKYLTDTFPKVSIPHRLTAYPMTKYADTHYLGILLHWACTNGTFVHPCVNIQHERGLYRDFTFTTTTAITKGTPLLAIPEELVIGFKEGVDEFDRNALFDTQRENAFNHANKGLMTSSSSEQRNPAGEDEGDGEPDTTKNQPSDADICDFFFFCLGTLVADLVTALSSELTDVRYPFAKSLSRVRTVTNAPYLPENTVFNTANPLHVNLEAIEAAAKAQEEQEEAGLRVPEEEWAKLPPKARKMIDMRRKALEGKRRRRKEAIADRRQQQQDAQDQATMGANLDAEDAEGGLSVDAQKEEHHASLADVVLQMIRNYIQGGPLTNKVDDAELRWAVSICLSHSTPLVIGDRRSIGIVPIVSLFPHGGLATNAVVVARPSPALERACRIPPGMGARKMAEYAQRMSGGYEFPEMIRGEARLSGDMTKVAEEGGTAGFVYVVAMRDIEADEPIHLQAMAPVCEKDEESEHMWRLSCGAAPQSYYQTSEVASLSEEVLMTMLGA